jgi:hypothetical protein
MNARLTAIAGLWATVGAALPAGAAGFAPPEGCETFLTVQSRECSVSLLWRCDGAEDGPIWEANFSDGGLQSVVSYSASYQWLNALYMWDRSREEFLPPAADPIDLDALIGTGIDTYDFTMRRSEPQGTRDLRMVGADQLTGTTVTIDGHALEAVATELQILAGDGRVEYRSRGVQFLSRDLGLFFLGRETVTGSDGVAVEYDGTPVDIIRPGEPGFGTTVPLYDCNPQDAGFIPKPPMRDHEETTDDRI